MPNPTFWARTDSNSANNAALNLTGTSGPNGEPAIEITFQPISGGGDLTLDNNGGAIDTITVVFIGNVQYSFSFEIAGTLPASNSSVPDQFEAVPPDPGSVVYVITVYDYPGNGDTTRLVFRPEEDPTEAEMNDFGNGAIALANVSAVTPPPVCFLSGTLIQTPSGPVVVDDLQSGDLVMTVDGGNQPLVWATSSLHTWPGSDEKHKPILIKQGAFGTDLPDSDLSVSPLHHIVMKGKLCVALFGADEVLAPAKGLTGLAGVRVMAGKKEAEYFHLLMAQHEILIAQGVETESFYPGPTALQMMSAGQRASLLAVVPTLRDDPENGYGPTARKKITRRQAEQLVEAMKNEAKETEAFAG